MELVWLVIKKSKVKVSIAFGLEAHIRSKGLAPSIFTASAERGQLPVFLLPLLHQVLNVVVHS